MCWVLKVLFWLEGTFPYFQTIQLQDHLIKSNQNNPNKTKPTNKKSNKLNKTKSKREELIIQYKSSKPNPPNLMGQIKVNQPLLSKAMEETRYVGKIPWWGRQTMIGDHPRIGNKSNKITSSSSIHCHCYKKVLPIYFWSHTCENDWFKSWDNQVPRSQPTWSFTKI